MSFYTKSMNSNAVEASKTGDAMKIVWLMIVDESHIEKIPAARRRWKIVDKATSGMLR